MKSQDKDLSSPKVYKRICLDQIEVQSNYKMIHHLYQNLFQNFKQGVLIKQRKLIK